MAARFHVTGGVPLNGTVRPAGNKNAALPMIPPAPLARRPRGLVSGPRIGGGEAQLDLPRGLGADVAWAGSNALRIDPAGLRPGPLDPQICGTLRASILLAGPLLAPFGRA